MKKITIFSDLKFYEITHFRLKLNVERSIIGSMSCTFPSFPGMI